MTMTVTVKIECHSDYEAQIKTAGQPDVTMKSGETQEFTIWSEKSLHIFEVPAKKEETE